MSRKFLFAVLLCFGSIAMVASPVPSDSKPDAAAVSVTPAKSAVSRHFKFVTVDSFSRFRYMDTAPKKVTERDLQYKLSVRLQLNVTASGSTYVQSRGESGRSFASSWDYMGPGLKTGYWSFNLKSLFVGQKLGKNFEVQAGGVEYERGAGTEATSADLDGWLMGYRLGYSHSGGGWQPDKLNVTVGYVGDFSDPNAFSRFHRLGDENYVQVLAQKKVGEHVDASVEFNSVRGIRYAREAVHARKVPLFIADDVTVEALTRASDGPAFGWAGLLNKTLDKRGKFGAGFFYSHMPTGMFALGKSQVFYNGDLYGLGKRVGPSFRWSPVKNLEFSLLGSRRLDSVPGTRYRAQVAVRYQFASWFNRVL